MNQESRGGYFRGFTLIEALVSLFIFSVITMAFYQTWALGTQHIINAKSRLGATALANEQMEIARSLIFDDIGTTTGIPVGTILRDQSIFKNTKTYNVRTVVQFVDDPADGTLALGTDIAFNDYKKVTITVKWGEEGPSEQVVIVSNFALDGVESVAAGTGILSINIFNNAGAGIAGASVHIVNTDVTPNVDITTDTDVNGNATFPGAPESQESYQISVSKSGYYGNTTYPPNPISSFNPHNVHSSVVAGSLTPATLKTDQLSEINFHTRDPFDVVVPNIDFTLSGGLDIGTSVSDGSPVYDYSQNTSTNAGGEKNLTDRSAGLYTVDLDAGETGYQFLRVIPEASVFGTYDLLPGITASVTMVLADKTLSSALITVQNSADSTPLAGASVHMTETVSGYDTTVVADTYGQAYFPTAAAPLVAGTYTVEISAAGYTTENGTINIGGTEMETRVFSLTAS